MATYEREQVERLIPGVWDEWRVLDLPDDARPDPDMPKAPTVDPRRSTDKVAELADIQRAWKKSGLTDRQGQVLLLRFGLDFTNREAGVKLGLDESTVRHHSFNGITILLDFLNGTGFGELLTELEN